MNFQYAVTYLLRRLGVGLGIISMAGVGFSPIETSRDGDSTTIDARLHDAVTEQVRTLIDSTTPVEIRYEITELLASGAKRRSTIVKRIAFDTLSESYTVSRAGAGEPRRGGAGGPDSGAPGGRGGSAGEGDRRSPDSGAPGGEGDRRSPDSGGSADDDRRSEEIAEYPRSAFSAAEAELSRVSFSVRHEELVGVVVEATLEVPSVADKSLVRGLWGGREPTATVRFPE